MTESKSTPFWWTLHLRVARGETLSADETRLYQEELARQDREACSQPVGISTLRLLREQVGRLAAENADLRASLAHLEIEQKRLEQSLSRETRQLLGIGE